LCILRGGQDFDPGEGRGRNLILGGSYKISPGAYAIREGDQKKKWFYHLDGKIYFDRKTEKGIFFILTILVVCYFILERLGLFG